MATVAITNGHNVVVSVSFEMATNPVHISNCILCVFLLCKRIKFNLQESQKAKCEFGKEKIKFLGHVINTDGISAETADPQKIEAIVNIQVPFSISGLRRFLGMTN